MSEFRDHLEFDGVTFAYDDEPVLSDIGFTARKGEIVALVGASGAGKSTLVDLIPRFYEPTGGRILLDGVDTREIALPSRYPYQASWTLLANRAVKLPP